MTMTGNHAPMLRSRSKDDWDGNARSVDLPLAQVIDEHLAAEAPDTFVISLDAEAFEAFETLLDVFPGPTPRMAALLSGPSVFDEQDDEALPGLLPGESYGAFYRRTELDDDGAIDLEAHVAGWGTVFDPNDLGWGFSVVDGASIRTPGQSYRKAF